MAERPISQGPGQLSRQVTQIPEMGAGFTRVLVKVAGLRLGLLKVMLILLFCCHFIKMTLFSVINLTNLLFSSHF
jgi:hypothetical protein